MIPEEQAWEIVEEASRLVAERLRFSRADVYSALAFSGELYAGIAAALAERDAEIERLRAQRDALSDIAREIVVNVREGGFSYTEGSYFYEDIKKLEAALAAGKGEK